MLSIIRYIIYLRRCKNLYRGVGNVSRATIHVACKAIPWHVNRYQLALQDSSASIYSTNNHLFQCYHGSFIPFGDITASHSDYDLDNGHRSLSTLPLILAHITDTITPNQRQLVVGSDGLSLGSVTCLIEFEFMGSDLLVVCECLLFNCNAVVVSDSLGFVKSLHV